MPPDYPSCLPIIRVEKDVEFRARQKTELLELLNQEVPPSLYLSISLSHTHTHTHTHTPPLPLSFLILFNIIISVSVTPLCSYSINPGLLSMFVKSFMILS